MMELVVTIFVFGLVLSSMATLTIGLQKSDGQSLSRVNGTQDALTAMRSMSRNISRGVAPSALGGSETSAVTSAGATGLTLYSYVDDPTGAVGPSLIQYTLDGGVLTQTVKVPKAGTRYEYCSAADASTECSGRVTTGVLCRGVRNSDSDPLFVYRDADGAVTNDPAQVRSIDVALVVGASAVRVVDHLALDNLTRATS